MIYYLSEITSLLIVLLKKAASVNYSMPLVYTYKASKDCYVVSGQNYIEPSVNAIPNLYDDGVNGIKNVKEIADFAFQNLNNLQTAIIPSGIDYIGTRSFYRCIGLGTVFILDSPAYINSGAYQECTNLSQVSFGNKINYIGHSSFKATKIPSCDLSNLDLLSGIEADAFRTCSFMTTLNLPTNLKYIGNSAFESCFNLFSGKNTEYIYIPKNLELLGASAFRFCAQIKGIRMGSRKLKKIKPYSFYQCTNLADFFLPDSGELKSIDTEAFTSCKLKNFYIPSGYNITGLEPRVFNNCSSLEYINLGTGHKSIPVGLCLGNAKLRRIDIPETVKNIGSLAFKDCYSIGFTGATIRDGGKSLYTSKEFTPSGLFVNAPPMQPLSSYPTDFSGVGYLSGDGTGINDLITITGIYPKDFQLPTGVSFISYAGGGPSIPGYLDNTSPFFGARLARDFFIPKDLNNFDVNIFTYANNIFNFNVHPDNSSYTSLSGIIYTKNTGFLVLAPSYRGQPYQTTSIAALSGATGIDYSPYAISEKANRIGPYAFALSTLFDPIDIPTGINYISDYAFYVTSFNECILHDKISYLGRGAFQLNQYLTGIKMPTGLLVIPPDFLRDCWSIENISIPDSTTYIGQDAFTRCRNLNKIHFGKNIIVGGMNNPAEVVTQASYEGITYRSLNWNDWFSSDENELLSNYYPLTGFSVSPDNPQLREISGVLYSKNSGALIRYPPRKAVLDGFDTPPYKTYSPPDYVTGIARGAFQDCIHFRYVNFDYNIKNIGVEVLKNATRLKHLIISNGKIGSYIIYPTFLKIPDDNNLFTKLTGVTFGETGIFDISSISSFFGIGYSSRVTGIASIYLPSGFPNIKNRPDFFDNIPNLSGIHVSLDNQTMTSSNGIVYSKNLNEIIKVPIKIGGDIVLPDNITGFGSAFSETQISSIKLGTGIKKMGEFREDVLSTNENVLFGCPSLTGVDLGDGLEEMAPIAISYCLGLKKITFGKNIKIFNMATRDPIGRYKIYNSGIIEQCYALQEIIYPYKDFIITQASGSAAIQNFTKITGKILEESTSWSGNLTTPQSDGFGYLLREIIPLAIYPVKPQVFGYGCFNNMQKITRYTPQNTGDIIINHINPNYKNIGVPNASVYSIRYSGEINIPQSLINLNVVALSGGNNENQLFSQDDLYTKVISIPTGVNVHADINASFGISGLKVLTGISVNNNPYLHSEKGILYNKNKTQIIAVPRECEQDYLCLEDTFQSISSEAFAYNENINSINFKGNAPQIGQNVFTGANPNLKIYRKKYVVDGWSDYLQDRKTYFKSNNIIITNGPNNKFNIFTGGNGEMVTSYSC